MKKIFPNDKILPQSKSYDEIAKLVNEEIEKIENPTFQSLSGRGDSKYPSELVVGNVYPLRSTKEPTESLICEELAHVLGTKLLNGRNSLSVAAYRVSVQRGHLIDLRIRFDPL